MGMKNKIAWRKEREDEISCDYQNRLGEKERELDQKIKAARERAIESLRKRIETLRRNHEASLNRMRENHDLQIDKLRGGR